MKIGIFGGSFNPPHKIHLKIAKTLLDKGYVEKIIFVPTGNKYSYKNNLIDSKYRYEMLKIMTKEVKEMEVSDYELKNYVVYTWDTLEYFRKLYKDAEIYFICGLDNLSYLDEWYRGIDILTNYKIIAFTRNKYSKEEILAKFIDYQNNITVIESKDNNYSATKIREYLKNGLDVANYLDKGVMEYIKNNKLYLS